MITHATRHYSPADKDRIAEALFELKEIMKKELDPLQLEVQRVWQLWNQRLQQPDNGKPLLIDETIGRITQVASTADGLANRIYVGLASKYQSYKPLLDDVLTPNHPQPLHDVREEAWRFRNLMNDASRIYQQSPQACDELARLIVSSMQSLTSRNTILNGWLHDTRRRIDEREKSILGSRHG